MDRETMLLIKFETEALERCAQRLGKAIDRLLNEDARRGTVCASVVKRLRIDEAGGLTELHE